LADVRWRLRFGLLLEGMATDGCLGSKAMPSN
jgi:hypothetical protein